MIQKLWALIYLWHNNYCTKHFVEKHFAEMGFRCPECLEDDKKLMAANVAHAATILKS